MVKNRYAELFNRWLLCCIIVLIGCLAIGFSVSFINLFEDGFIFNNKLVITAISIGLITALSTLTVTFYVANKELLFKSLFTIEIVLSILIVALYYFQYFDFWEKFDSVEDIRSYVSSFGAHAVLVFILIQFLQVIILPIPSVLTIGAGVLSFGAFLGALYSYIGIILGSITAYFLGKTFGYKLASWLFGKNKLDTWIKRLRGKDKLLITFMFLFPFFPDDLLCFVAGITVKNKKFFLIMVTLVRLVTIFTSAYSLNNSLIPYDTWWGIIVWLLFFTVTIFFTSYILRNSEKILYKLRNIRKNQTKNK